MRRGHFALTTCFSHKIFEKKTLQNICCFHKFSVEGHLYEHYCTLEQLVGKTLIETESAVAKQKMCDLVSVKTFCPFKTFCNFLPPPKGYLKTCFEFRFGPNINFIYSNSSQ